MAHILDRLVMDRLGSHGFSRMAARLFGAIILIGAASAPGAAAKAATVFTSIYEFQGSGQTPPFPSADGANPVASLIADSAGNLYGTTRAGGTGSGTVFKLTRSKASPTGWIETILHTFQDDGTDGVDPMGALVMDGSGALYGTTALGGNCPDHFCGTVFKLTPPKATGGNGWVETILYNFQESGDDGNTPEAGVIIGKGGVLYGTTTLGGATGNGIVFALTPNKNPPHAGPTIASSYSEAILYSFGDGSDGEQPAAALVADGSGTLYGTTPFGGDYGDGTVFALAPPPHGSGPWTETVLYSFDYSDGEFPRAALIFDSNGALYGTTSSGGIDQNCPSRDSCATPSAPTPVGCQQGCGTVFKLAPPAVSNGSWTETTLYLFQGTTDGGYPSSALVLAANGALYGTTAGAGEFEGPDPGAPVGTVFQLSPPRKGGVPWNEKVLHHFTPRPKGFDPEAGLVAPFGAGHTAISTLYGTTALGGTAPSVGCESGCGTVFQINP